MEKNKLKQAAEEYANKEHPDEPSVGQWGTGDYEPLVDREYLRETAKDAFKAGAEWMAEQGVVVKGFVMGTKPNYALGIENSEKLEVFDDKSRQVPVIVQIRKK